MNKDAITDKVKKLLRLAGCKSATPAEAANALNRAKELMDRHHIDVASLDLDADTERLVCEKIKVGQRVSLIKRLVVNILRNHFNVKCIYDHVDVAVIGFEHDVTMAGYVFHFLVGACNRSVKEFCALEKKARRKMSETKKKNYIQGWIYGVTKNIRSADDTGKALQDSQTAIVLSARQNRVTEYFDSLYPASARRPITLRKARENWKIIGKGFADGRSTTIATPLNGGKPFLALE